MCESGLAISYQAYCTQPGSAHTEGNLKMAWAGKSTLAISFQHVLLVTPIAVARRDQSPVTGT